LTFFSVFYIERYIYIFRAYEQRVQSVHRSRARNAKKGPVNFWKDHSLGHKCLFWFFFIFIRVFSTIFSLFRKIIIHVEFTWTFMKVYQWFYWTVNPQFWEMSQPEPGAPKQACTVFALIFLHLLAGKPNLENNSIYSNIIILS